MGGKSPKEEKPINNSYSSIGSVPAVVPKTSGLRRRNPVIVPEPELRGPIDRPQKNCYPWSSFIDGPYSELEKVTEEVCLGGHDLSNLIVGIDFTKSNELAGSFWEKSLHCIGDSLNPYEQAITTVGKALAATFLNENNSIPCYGFGDASTKDQDIFSFYPEERSCNGLEDALSRYREIVPHLKLAGPTSFAPVIEKAMTVVEQSGGQYHLLLIITDGQVTRSVETEPGHLSPQEQRTVNAIVEASKFPLSIVLIGVGDEPWDRMREFYDNIPARDFDNFKFINFTKIMSKNVAPIQKETDFALSALKDIPPQYKAIIELNILGRKGVSPNRVALPPPLNNDPMSSQSTSPPVPSSTYKNQECPICYKNLKDMVFGCGHQTCCECGQTLKSCPICRKPIEIRIKVY